MGRDHSLLRGSGPDITDSHMVILTFPEFMKAVFFLSYGEQHLGRGEILMSSFLGAGMPWAGMQAPLGAFQAKVRS